MIGINIGSGQRPFASTDGFQWINVDCQAKWNPDLVADWNDLNQNFGIESVDLVVAHHVLEHVGCGEADGLVREAHRVLKLGCSLLVFVPDMRALAQRFILNQLDEQVYMTSVYGAYMGDESDRHRWGWSRYGLWIYLKKTAPWNNVHEFDWRPIVGASLAKDWWIIAMEVVK